MAFSAAGRAALRAITGRHGHYNPDQARVPRGHSDGGQWTDDTQAVDQFVAQADEDPQVMAARMANDEIGGDIRLHMGVLNPDGTYNAAAQLVNKQIAESFLDPAAKPAFGTQPVATFVIGRPGAGKSTTLSQPSVASMIPRSVTINADDIKGKLPGFSNKLAPAYHEWSSDVSKTYLMPKVLEGRYNLVYDSVGGNPEKMARMAAGLQKAGYRVQVIHIETTRLLSVQRAHERFLRGGRFVDLHIVKAFRDGPEKSFQAMKPFAGVWKSYDATKPTRK